MFTLRRVLQKSTTHPSLRRTFTTGSIAVQSRFTDFVHSVRDSSHIEEISVAALNSLSKPPGFHLVDVRETSELENGIIPGAICIPRGLLEKDIEKNVPITEEVVVYCASGYRSILAAESLKRMGYKVKSLKGGFGEWKKGADAINPPLESTTKA
ncbi:Rhodanese-like protein [Basidiobolus meristosporus CBS 931.73]|uniref:Rhodanese-like protein n=1 Tax=Basidiobolus meristosporus CBS 931.73 TaxID=1314790 RepID=A0A1Y1X8T9_9FUNG|nr:Rhodanese-like protein [Basidiobolus meristosporus CBS 931.73]|eukprot:ORX82163.1 Rhodanese-like protein [Basidiobolus meristosporus CBS 931.73]